MNCRHQGCITVLRATNPTGYCGSHTPPSIYDRIAPRLPLWTEEAVCAGMDTDTFHPEVPVARGLVARHLPAILICSFCPVVKECIEWGLQGEKEGETERYPQGIYGGTIPADRTETTDKSALLIRAKQNMATAASWGAYIQERLAV